MTETPNLTLPYLAAGQAQKHVTINESLRRLDAIVQVAVLDRDLAAPPTTPAAGERYIVGDSPTGAWSGHAGHIAAWQDGAWEFYVPKTGWIAFIVDEALLVFWTGTTWGSSGSQSLNPAALIGVSTTADATNKLAVSSPASLFNHAGAGHQLKINKAAANQTGSLLFQTGFSGRAEMGLAGDDDFRIKVSANGTSWVDALSINRTTGAVSLPNTASSGGGAIRQIRNATKLTGFTTQSTSPVATGLVATITPQSASNRILVRASLTLGARFWYTTPEITVRRNGVKIWPQGTLPAMRHAFLSSTDSNSNLVTLPATIEFEDNPASLAALTYEVFLNSSAAGYNAHLNLREHDLTLRGESSLSLTEFVP